MPSFALIVSRFNQPITDALRDGARAALAEASVTPAEIEEMDVPGAFELPQAARYAAGTGRFDAVVEQLCAVSLDSFEQPLSGEIELRAVPEGSPQAPEPSGGEVDYDPEAPDPPDVLHG